MHWRAAKDWVGFRLDGGVRFRFDWVLVRYMFISRNEIISDLFKLSTETPVKLPRLSWVRFRLDGGARFRFDRVRARFRLSEGRCTPLDFRSLPSEFLLKTFRWSGGRIDGEKNILLGIDEVL